MARPKSDDRRSAILAAAIRIFASQGLGAPTATIAWIGDQPDLVKAWNSPPPPPSATPDPADSMAEPLTGSPAERAARAVVDQAQQRAQDDPAAPSPYHAHPVGMLAANAWGFHDMHGNVAEWCGDAWDRKSAYDAGNVTDPDNEAGNCSIVRGGSWFQVAGASRSAARAGIPADGKADWVGFRFVLTEVAVKAKPGAH